MVSFARWEAQRGHTNVFGGAFTVRRTLRLRLGRSGGRLSVGPESIMEIPAEVPSLGYEFQKSRGESTIVQGSKKLALQSTRIAAIV